MYIYMYFFEGRKYIIRSLSFSAVIWEKNVFRPIQLIWKVCRMLRIGYSAWPTLLCPNVIEHIKKLTRTDKREIIASFVDISSVIYILYEIQSRWPIGRIPILMDRWPDHGQWWGVVLFL